MGIALYQIDSFANAPFEGNPAAVCLMTEPASDDWLQKVAIEMNLSETAFVWREDSQLRLRWFTPGLEVDLCGHATLAAAHAIWDAGWMEPSKSIVFASRSGRLEATRTDGVIWLDFPAVGPVEAPPVPDLVEALGVKDVRWFGKNQFDYFLELADEKAVLDCRPEFGKLGQLTERGAIVTAASERPDVDFVSRFFGPACGIDEDPVTGSAHAGLSPYWVNKMGINDLVGYQASPRGGFVSTRLAGDRVHLGGKALTIFKTELLCNPSA